MTRDGRPATRVEGLSRAPEKMMARWPADTPRGVYWRTLYQAEQDLDRDTEPARLQLNRSLIAMQADYEETVSRLRETLAQGKAASRVVHNDYTARRVADYEEAVGAAWRQLCKEMGWDARDTPLDAAER